MPQAGFEHQELQDGITADRQDTISRELGTKKGRSHRPASRTPEVARRLTKTVAPMRRNPVKFAGHRSPFYDDYRNRPWPTHD